MLCGMTDPGMKLLRIANRSVQSFKYYNITIYLFMLQCFVIIIYLRLFIYDMQPSAEVKQFIIK